MKTKRKIIQIALESDNMLKPLEKSEKKEAWVKSQVKEFLKANNIWFFMPQNIGMGQSGIPDFICCLHEFNGKMLGIETKRPGKRSSTTALQDRQITAIRAARGWAIVVDDVSQLKEFLDACRSEA